MLGKPRILSLFPNSFNKFKKHEHSCKILYVILSLKIDVDPEELLHYKGWSRSPSFVSILALIKHISKYIPCADPESFVRGGPTLTRVSVC